MTLALCVITKLTQKKKSISVAESCTGGMIGHILTNISGSSAVFKGGIIAYENSIKNKLLNVSHSTLTKHGAVSVQVVHEMAQNAKKIFQSDFALAVSGIAGPRGGTAQKPVGLVFIALATPQKTIGKKFHFQGTRLQIKSQTTQHALQLLLENIK